VKKGVKKYVLRGVLGAVGLVVGIAGVLALREATLSTHQPIDPDSQVEVVFDAEARHREEGQTVDELAEALVVACRLEVSSDIVGEVEPYGDPDGDDDRYRAVLQPAFDDTNERQFRGCMEDFTLDQLRAHVLRIEPIAT
jgi:hypothetical protein